MTMFEESRRGSRSHATDKKRSTSPSSSRSRHTSTSSRAVAPGRPGGVSTSSRSRSVHSATKNTTAKKSVAKKSTARKPSTSKSSTHKSSTQRSSASRATTRTSTSRTVGRKQQQSRRAMSVNASPVLVAVAQGWDFLLTATSGEVPAQYKSQRITSTNAHQKVKKRLRLSVAVFAVLLCALMGRVIMLQSFGGEKYLQASIDQRTRVNIVRAERGVIFDRNGNELALSVPSTTVYADPRDVLDPVGTARALAPVLGLDAEKEAELAADLAEPGSKFRYISRELSKPQADAILGLGLAGIYSYIEPSRQVEGGVAQAIIGRTDPDGIGASGLEKQFNDVLSGKDGKSVREVDKRGRSIPGAENTTDAPIPGDDIVLSVDKSIQYNTDAALLDRVGQLNAKGGTAIVMNSKTGEIYAMSNVRRGPNGETVVATGNFAAVEAYEPGSVAKVFSISAALNEGAVTPETVMRVPGIITIDKFPIRDAWPHGLIDMDVKTIMTESSNIGTLMTAQKIEPHTLRNYLAAFGFGQTSGLNFPGESKGILRDASKWRGTEKVTVSYGYGLSATALQLVAGVNTVANGGTYVAPRLVNATIDKNGKQRPVEPSITRPVLKPETAAQITDMLRGVVCTGTGSLAKVKGMEVAGKTGTGYKVQSNGTYQTDSGGRKYFASFVGFFPARNPQVTILVSIDEPDSSSRDRFGGTAAAPVFARLVPNVMQELGIEATGTGTGCASEQTPAGH